MVVIRIHGNVHSLRESVINELEALYDLTAARDEFIPGELALKLAELTGRINREIAVYLDRKGNVLDVSIGDSSTVSLAEVDGRKNAARLSGVRCIHTHPNGDGRISAVDVRSLVALRLDAMIALGARESGITEVYCALPLKNERGEFDSAEVYGPFTYDDNRWNALPGIIAERDKTSGALVHLVEGETERTILIGLETAPGRTQGSKSEGERSLEELEELALTAGAEVVHKVLQRRAAKDAAFFIGKGKVEELALLRQAMNANLLIFDDELSGAQVRNIEDITGAKVIDRTNLILDIFAQRARSREGKLQVELAQLKYRLPRLVGMGGQLSRLGGGIGTRGPGEKKLEADRRHIGRRVSYLERELEALGKRRSLMRAGRKQKDVPVIALVGYTNAGKSTLMNALCNAEVFAEDKLFATLDPTVRSLRLPGGREVLLTDTVGFIRKLPHELIEAFKSTLEEAVSADLLLHIVDLSSDEAETQVQVVDKILESLGALNKPAVMVKNKMDRVRGEVRFPLSEIYREAFEVSAVTGQGLDALQEGILRLLPEDEIKIEIFAPYSAGWILPYLHQNGKVMEESYKQEGSRITASIRKSAVDKVRQYLQKP